MTVNEKSMTLGEQLLNKWEQVIQAKGQDKALVLIKTGTSSQILTLKNYFEKYLGKAVSKLPISEMTLLNHDLDLVLLRRYDMNDARKVFEFISP